MTKFNDVLKYLSSKDTNLDKIISIINIQINTKYEDDFTSLVKIIISQQLSGSAAKTIIGKLENQLDNNIYDSRKISIISNKDLRLCGISNAKINYIKGLSDILVDNPLYFKKLRDSSKNEVINELSKIKGIGIWTASIFAMGPLGFEDIFPYGDVTLIKAIKLIYGEDSLVEDVISKWSPYKTYACRLLWQWVDKGMMNINTN
jgi:DNA-3-methyladenine glycosylase II